MAWVWYKCMYVCVVIYVWTHVGIGISTCMCTYMLTLAQSWCLVSCLIFLYFVYSDWISYWALSLPIPSSLASQITKGYPVSNFCGLGLQKATKAAQLIHGFCEIQTPFLMFDVASALSSEPSPQLLSKVIWRLKRQYSGLLMGMIVVCVGTIRTEDYGNGYTIVVSQSK